MKEGRRQNSRDKRVEKEARKRGVERKNKLGKEEGGKGMKQGIERRNKENRKGDVKA